MDCAEPRAEPPQVSASTPRRADGLKMPPIMPTNHAVRLDAPQERAAAEGGEASSSAASVAESDGATAAAAVESAPPHPKPPAQQANANAEQPMTAATVEQRTAVPLAAVDGYCDFHSNRLVPAVPESRTSGFRPATNASGASTLRV